MNEAYCMIITTAPSKEDAESISRTLLEERLAVYAQVMPGQSYYRWLGRVESNAEQVILIKTKRSLYEQVQARILDLHPYEIPEIVQVPITNGLPAYFDWIEQECG